MTDQTPRTATGRALFRENPKEYDLAEVSPEQILAIEAEAAADPQGSHCACRDHDAAVVGEAGCPCAGHIHR